MKNTKYIIMLIVGVLFVFNSCQKDEYDLKELVAPTNVKMSYEIVGYHADTAMYGDGSGIVNFTVSADNAITYYLDFGDGSNLQTAPGGKASKLFSITGVNTYNVTVSAVGTGGITSTLTDTVAVYSLFEDEEALQFLTGGSSKSWFWAADVPEHVGMGPQSADYGKLDYTWPNWWKIDPFDDEKDCMYDAEFVFTAIEDGLTFEQISGPAFVPGHYANKINIPGDKCYGVDTIPNLYGVKNVSFAPSTSRPAIDGGYRGTSMTFSDDGFMCWWVGNSEYDIIQVTDTTLMVRIKEAESPGEEEDLKAAWYHIFTNEKPIPDPEQK